MADPGKGSRDRGKALYVGGAEVRLIRAGRSPEGAPRNTAGSRSVLVPSGGCWIEDFPAVDRLVRSMRQTLPDDRDGCR